MERTSEDNITVRPLFSEDIVNVFDLCIDEYIHDKMPLSEKMMVKRRVSIQINTLINDNELMSYGAFDSSGNILGILTYSYDDFINYPVIDVLEYRGKENVRDALISHIVNSDLSDFDKIFIEADDDFTFSKYTKNLYDPFGLFVIRDSYIESLKSKA